MKINVTLKKATNLFRRQYSQSRRLKDSAVYKFAAWLVAVALAVIACYQFLTDKSAEISENTGENLRISKGNSVEIKSNIDLTASVFQGQQEIKKEVEHQVSCREKNSWRVIPPLDWREGVLSVHDGDGGSMQFFKEFEQTLSISVDFVPTFEGDASYTLSLGDELNNEAVLSLSGAMGALETYRIGNSSINHNARKIAPRLRAGHLATARFQIVPMANNLRLLGYLIYTPVGKESEKVRQDLDEVSIPFFDKQKVRLSLGLTAGRNSNTRMTLIDCQVETTRI